MTLLLPDFDIPRSWRCEWFYLSFEREFISLVPLELELDVRIILQSYAICTDMLHRGVRKKFMIGTPAYQQRE
jgi:hypothetical protein